MASVPSPAHRPWSRDGREPVPGSVSNHGARNYNGRMWGVAVAAVIPVILGIVVLVRSRQRWCGVLLVAHGASAMLVLGLEPDASASPAASTGAGSWVLLYFWLVLLAYLAPTGRAASRRWRRWIAAGSASVILFAVLAGLDAVIEEGQIQAVPEPVAVSVQVLSVLAFAGSAAFFLGVLPAVFLRLRRAQGKERSQLLWLVFGSMGIPLGLLLLWANHLFLGAVQWVDQMCVGLVVIGLPLCMAVAVLRHELFDIHVVLSRALAYGVLLLAVYAAYAVVLALAGTLSGGGALATVLVLAAVVAVGNPLFSRVRRAAERWAYGYRATPNAALRELSRRLAGVAESRIEAAICDGVCQLLRVPEAWFEPLGEPAAAGTHRVELSYRGHPLAALAIQLPQGRKLSAGDHALLADLCGYAALVLHVERLNGQLSASRTRIITAREEERRRLRHDLHDGLGPTLAGLTLKLQAAERSLDGALIREACDDAAEAVGEIRRVVEGLRPPALDEVGLLGAVEQQALRLSGATRVRVLAGGLPAQIPAAVEVAAYRIVVEAVSNAVEHAGAASCTVEITESPAGSLCLTISDNGTGWPQGTPGGTGWESMSERAAEIGGSCTRREVETGGTRICVALPLGIGSAKGAADDSHFAC